MLRAALRSVSLKPVRDKILESLYQTTRVAILEHFIRHGGQIHVLGGAVRDAIAFDCGYDGKWAPRDFDLGVTGVRLEEFEYVLSTFGQKNRHGGFVVKEHGLPVWDLWRLESSIGLRTTGTFFTLENVLRTFNLDCNAIALDMHTGVLTDAGAIEAIRRRRVGFVCGVIKHSYATFAAKALLMQMRFGYSASPEVSALVDAQMDTNTLVYESRKVFPELPIVSRVPQVRERACELTWEQKSSR